jgi:hypothetical protein
MSIVSRLHRANMQRIISYCYAVGLTLSVILVTNGAQLQQVLAGDNLAPSCQPSLLNSRCRRETAMYVTIQLRQDVAIALQQRQINTPAAQELFKTAQELGVELKPMHPGARDSYLAPYFTAEVPNSATAERVINRLRNCEAVEAAYVKPADEMP